MHRDSSPLCYDEIRYLCSPWYHAGPFLFCGVRRRVTRCALLSQAQRVCLRARLVGSWMRTWARVKEYHTPNPTQNRKAPKAMKSLWKVRSRSYVACVCIPNPNSRVTYWVFHKILKSRATYIFQVKARRQCTVDGRAHHGSWRGDIFRSLGLF